jgi:predicted nucleic acid-binding protein
MTRWFVDTSYVVALANETDALHEAALKYSSMIEEDGIELVTTEAVLVEVASALSKARYRSHAVVFVDALRDGAEVIPFSANLLVEGWEMFKRHLDKEWTWVDTMSFVTMRREGMTEALTSDHHFEQAAFRPLLRAEKAP